MTSGRAAGTQHAANRSATSAGVFTICSRLHVVANGGLQREVGKAGQARVEPDDERGLASPSLATGSDQA